MLVASIIPLRTDVLILAPEPVTNPNPWLRNTTGQKLHRGLSRARQFLRKPSREKTEAILFHFTRRFPNIPIPVRLPFGAWWLARNDFVGAQLFHSGFENVECSFVEHFLRLE